MTRRVISSPADLEEGADWLASRSEVFARLLPDLGPLPLRRKPEGFATLLNAIVGQQVSLASAAAIWGRVVAAGFAIEENAAGASDAELAACGLSRPKIRYTKALATARLPYQNFADMPDQDVITRLCEVTGIGRWSAEIYVKFSLGRADVFAAGDLALQEAARVAFELPARPSEKALREMALDWSPWRAVAARALWAYYRVLKDREGVI